MMDRAAEIGGLFEAHLAVGDLDRSIAFYRGVVGLELAFRAPEIGAAFLWIGGRGNAMLGLWARGSAPMNVTLHLAFKLSLEGVMSSPRRLRSLGIAPLSFDGAETDEPSVIGWMPAAAVYYRDPDGHLLEHLAMLDSPPDPERRVVSWTEWTKIEVS
jgi:lactoylglutathione lyase